MTEGPRGLNVGAVSEWLASAVAQLHPPFEFALIAAGGSNLTYEVTSANQNRVALRRPPEGSTLATAHDTDREYRIMSALHAARAHTRVRHQLGERSRPDRPARVVARKSPPEGYQCPHWCDEVDPQGTRRPASRCEDALVPASAGP